MLVSIQNDSASQINRNCSACCHSSTSFFMRSTRFPSKDSRWPTTEFLKGHRRAFDRETVAFTCLRFGALGMLKCKWTCHVMLRPEICRIHNMIIHIVKKLLTYFWAWCHALHSSEASPVEHLFSRFPETQNSHRELLETFCAGNSISHHFSNWCRLVAPLNIPRCRLVLDDHGSFIFLNIRWLTVDGQNWSLWIWSNSIHFGLESLDWVDEALSVNRKT